MVCATHSYEENNISHPPHKTDNALFFINQNLCDNHMVSPVEIYTSIAILWKEKCLASSTAFKRVHKVAHCCFDGKTIQ